jgi:putative PEP-CTERM system histidine kinase
VAATQNISLILFSIGCACFVWAAIIFVIHRRKIFDPPSTVIATLGLAVWQGTLAWNSVHNLPESVLLGIELLRPLLILLYLHRTLRTSSGSGLTNSAIASTLLLALLIPFLIAFVHPEFVANKSSDYFTLQRAWVGIFISVGLLIALEQVFRNAAGAPAALVRYACLALGITAMFDLYLFADTLIFEQLDANKWRARGGINAFGAAFTAILVRRARAVTLITVSRNVVFYTASLTAAGIFLLAISIAGYAIREYGGSWGSVLQLMLFFASVMFIAATALSQQIRDRVRVYIAKNFFTLRYDYRQEWLNLIAQLTGKESSEDLYVRAIRVLADLYKCAGGILWLKSEGAFVPTAPCRMKLPQGCMEPVGTPFCAKLGEEWIFELDIESDPDRAPPPPMWAQQIPELGIFVPLLVEDELIGFIGLQRSLGFERLTWEDLEILKTAARQVASYLARFQAGEQLARARQFDTYHQLTAFIMHDLKNLIAQQELVVKNAAKHKENPAFVEDAIDTIQNSVRRMSALLGKLQQREPAERRTIELREVILEAMRKCESIKPAPSLRISERDLRVNSDRDHLVMVLSHIIKNAQEATRDDGFVDVTLRREGDNAVIEVEDNGSGMDADFIRQRLFKPFESTKAGKGMGIGAFQAREFIRGMGGDIAVNSTLGEGTVFTLTVPLVASTGVLKLAQGMNHR